MAQNVSQERPHGLCRIGWLFHNQEYFARPDNTGRALFRYVAHFDLDLYKQKFVLFGDVNMFTDREASNTVEAIRAGLDSRHRHALARLSN